MGAGALLLVLAGSRGASQPPPPAVFRAGVEGVFVDTFVTSGGRPVTGLSAADFELRDDGVVQPLELLPGAPAPRLSVLAFDTSGSVAGEKLGRLRAAGEVFLATLRPEDHVGLLAFHEELEWLVPPTGDPEAVRAALPRLRPRGATSVFDALYAALVLTGPHTRSLVVLFTDGGDNMSWLGAAEVLTVAERASALVHVVAIRPPRDKARSYTIEPRGRVEAVDHVTVPENEPRHVTDLRRIAEATGGRVWWADSPEQLSEAFAAVAEAMGKRYVLRFDPGPAPRPGWHRIEVRLRGRKGEVRARGGYWVEPR